MFRIDHASAVTALPEPLAAGTPGYFTRGDVSTNTPPTVFTADFANMLQEELMAIITAAGIDPSKTDDAQVLAALQALFATPAFATDAGVGSASQSWQNVTASRTSGSTYYNTTSRPIEVMVVFPDTSDLTAYATVAVNGVTLVNNVLFDKSDSTASFCVSFIVPPEQSYTVSCSGGTIGQWNELR